MNYVADLIDSVEQAAGALGALVEGTAARRPAPGAWSPKEIIGHLIDSACINHQRFVRAQWQENLLFTGYDQDAWVASQRYQDAPWTELVALWRLYNLQLARVMAAIPEPARTRAHRRHNLHQIAWRVVPEDAPATLDYLMSDYVEHLKHHLRQIDAILARSPA